MIIKNDYQFMFIETTLFQGNIGIEKKYRLINYSDKRR